MHSLALIECGYIIFDTICKGGNFRVNVGDHQDLLKGQIVHISLILEICSTGEIRISTWLVRH